MLRSLVRSNKRTQETSGHRGPCSHISTNKIYIHLLSGILKSRDFNTNTILFSNFRTSLFGSNTLDCVTSLIRIQNALYSLCTEGLFWLVLVLNISMQTLSPRQILKYLTQSSYYWVEKLSSFLPLIWWVHLTTCLHSWPHFLSVFILIWNTSCPCLIDTNNIFAHCYHSCGQSQLQRTLAF